MSEELENITEKKATLFIGGKERELSFRFSAWQKIEDKFGDIQTVFNKVKQKPFTVLPDLIYIGIVDKTGIKEADVVNYLDQYGLGDLKGILTKVQGAMMESQPKVKAGKSKNSKAAK